MTLTEFVYGLNRMCTRSIRHSWIRTAAYSVAIRSGLYLRRECDNAQTDDLAEVRSVTWQQSTGHVTCRLLCCSLLYCSVALYALLLCRHRAECRNERVSLVYRIVRFPSFIGASCSTHVLESVITTNRIHCANHFFPRLCQPLV